MRFSSRSPWSRAKVSKKAGLSGDEKRGWMSGVLACMTTLGEVRGKDSVDVEADGWGFAFGTTSEVIAHVTTLKEVEGKGNTEAEADDWGVATIRVTEVAAGVVDDGMVAAPPERLCFFEVQMPL